MVTEKQRVDVIQHLKEVGGYDIFWLQGVPYEVIVRQLTPAVMAKAMNQVIEENSNDTATS